MAEGIGSTAKAELAPGCSSRSFGRALSVELGRARMSIQDLLNMSPGSVIELDKIAGEPLDFMVNGRLVARGEAVVVNDKFGVRITDIVSPSERIARLR